ncbi:MAG TPA: cell division protein FtsI [Rhodobacteraceae bacterium]|nr:cell division protein FtsI [Paracoccaceae bacterium]
MIRTPLRPLARILEARARGDNPDAIERENLAARHEAMYDRDRGRAESRLFVLGLCFFAAFSTISIRMGVLAGTAPAEPTVSAAGVEIATQRAEILDRQGRILATNLETSALYAQPPMIVDPARAATELARIFPDLNAAALMEDFTGKRKFLWVRKVLSPEQQQAVHDIGEPGLLFGAREMRLYPNGALAAHVLGGASFGREGVSAAEVIGTAGIEKMFDDRLRDPARAAEPLQLSIDLTIQATMEQVLDTGMKLMNAKGAAGVLMDVHTGEVVAIASLPDFDPNERPAPPTKGNPSDSPLFNRAVQGVYELGSTFKIFTVAQAMELGLVNPETIINTSSPMQWGKHRIRDFKNYGPTLSVEKVIVKSSNVGTARIAQQIGAERQQSFLRSIGMMEATPLEIVEAKGGKPLLPPRWPEITTMTVSYGHGISTSPLHLAAGYAMIANGGTVVAPTLLRHPAAQQGARILSPETAAAARQMLRHVVTEGTASLGEVAGYEVAGKTGTADKPKETGGGYHKDKVIATFATMFPVSNPQYVLIVTLDEPVNTTGPEPRRTAGWTAVPVAAEMIRRVAPLLGLKPQIEPGRLSDITLTSN